MSNKFVIFLSVIVLASILLRFYSLSTNPPSLNWDEASIGYNAYSILKTGADEYGNKLPLSFRSFDDYKPPVYVYLTVPSIALFGLTEFAVRFPSALFGVLTVVAVYFLVVEILSISIKTTERSDIKTSKKLDNIIALASAFFLGISPWHLQFSRAAYEGNIGISFFVFSTLFFFKGLKEKKYLIISALFFGLSMFSYHSFRIISPVFISVLLIFFWKDLLKKKIYTLISAVIVILFFFTFAQSFFQSGGAGSRLSMVTVFGESEVLKQSQQQLAIDIDRSDYLGQLIHNRRVVYIQQILKGYFDHFNPDFLFFRGDGGVQHHAVNMGMMYVADIPLLILGMYFLSRRLGKGIIILFIWLFLAPIPSSVTTGTPHPVRAIAMIPVLQIISACGLVCGYYFFVKTNKIFAKIFIFITGLFLGLNIIYYLHQYYVHTPIEYGYFWQYGNKEAIIEAKRLEYRNDKIVFSYRYDQPYIYYLFYNKIDPLWYQKNWDYLGTGNTDRFERKIGKYEFRNIFFAGDKYLKKTLLIGAPDEFPKDVNHTSIVKYLDGVTAYKLVETKNGL